MKGSKTAKEKTNAMRKLDAMKINYREYTYVDTDAVSGVEVCSTTPIKTSF